MSYAIVVGDDVVELQEEVRAMMADGWQPLGGVACLSYRHTVERKGYDETVAAWAQAMVKP